MSDKEDVNIVLLDEPAEASGPPADSTPGLDDGGESDGAPEDQAEAAQAVKRGRGRPRKNFGPPIVPSGEWVRAHP